MKCRMYNLCGKFEYTSKTDAMKEIARIVKESFGGAMDLRAYRRKQCKKWHLTSNVK